ncbi:MAG: hypothetical protein PVF27_00215 [Gemmatimonadales bacterium]|jgi:hypothetical protein
MRIARSLTALALAATLTVACDSTTSPEDLTVEDVVGSWTATSIEYTLLADTTQKFDVIANGVASLSLSVQASGSFTFTFVLLGDSDSGTGTLTISNGVATITGAGDLDDSYTITAYDGTTLTMEAPSVDFDFPPPDGVEETASVEVVLQLQ